MKYSFGNGDNGETNIYNKKLSKSDDIIEAIGDLDELNASIGHVMSVVNDQKILGSLKSIEYIVYAISAQVAGYENAGKKLSEEDADTLDKEIDDYSSALKEVRGFIYPNGDRAATEINVCRTIARRAERSIIKAGINDALVKRYMNRLSSLLFVMFRYLNESEGTEEEIFGEKH